MTSGIFLVKTVIPILLILSLVHHDSNYIGRINAGPTEESMNGLMRVPLAWCIVQGSPVASNTQPDIALNERINKINEFIFTDRADIAFYSAVEDSINPSEGSPIIPDPNPSLGTEGNVTIDDIRRVEWKAMLSECKNEWKDRFVDGQVNGIYTINIRLLVDKYGNEIRDLLGVSSCIKDRSTGLCDIPYSGNIFVIDDEFTSVDGSRGLNNDPYDQTLGHETGHPCGLNHVVGNPEALMNSEQQENGPGGTVSNIHLSDEEVQTMRSNCILVPGSHFGLGIIPADLATEYSLIDDDDKIENILPFQNISSVILTINQNGTMDIRTELDGLFPQIEGVQDSHSTSYWTLIDLDGDITTGSKNSILNGIGIPPTNISGIDLAILGNSTILTNVSAIKNNHTQVWIIDPPGQNITLANPKMVEQNVDTMMLQFHFNKSLNNQTTNNFDYYDVVNYKLKGYKDIMNSTNPISIHSLVTSNNTVLDELNKQMNVSNYKQFKLQGENLQIIS